MYTSFGCNSVDNRKRNNFSNWNLKFKICDLRREHTDYVGNKVTWALFSKHEIEYLYFWHVNETVWKKKEMYSWIKHGQSWFRITKKCFFIRNSHRFSFMNFQVHIFSLHPVETQLYVHSIVSVSLNKHCGILFITFWMIYDRVWCRWTRKIKVILGNNYKANTHFYINYGFAMILRYINFTGKNRDYFTNLRFIIIEY